MGREAGGRNLGAASCALSWGHVAVRGRRLGARCQPPPPARPAGGCRRAAELSEPRLCASCCCSPLIPSPGPACVFVVFPGGTRGLSVGGVFFLYERVWSRQGLIELVAFAKLNVVFIYKIGTSTVEAAKQVSEASYPVAVAPPT